MSIERGSKNADRIDEQRILSDAELIKGGARIEEGVLKPTSDQVEAIKNELSAESDQSFVKIEERGGFLVQIVKEKSWPATERLVDSSGKPHGDSFERIEVKEGIILGWSTSRYDHEKYCSIVDPQTGESLPKDMFINPYQLVGIEAVGNQIVAELRKDTMFSGRKYIVDRKTGKPISDFWDGIESRSGRLIGIKEGFEAVLTYSDKKGEWVWP